MAHGNNRKGGTPKIAPIVSAKVMQGCRGKKRYHTMILAQEAAASASLESGHEINAYPCFICKGFHIGHALTYAKKEGVLPEDMEAQTPPKEPEVIRVEPKQKEALNTRFVKFRDEFKNYYLFELPRESAVTEEIVLSAGKLVATKNGEGYWTNLKGERCPAEEWRTYHHLHPTYPVYNIIGFKRLLDGMEEEQKEEVAPFGNRLAGLSKLKQQLPAHEEYLGKRVYRYEHDNKPYVVSEVKCKECGKTIELRAYVVEVGKRFTSLRSFTAVKDDHARPVEFRSPDWLCGDCVPAEEKVSKAKIIELPDGTKPAEAAVEPPAPVVEPEPEAAPVVEEEPELPEAAESLEDRLDHSAYDEERLLENEARRRRRPVPKQFALDLSLYSVLSELEAASVDVTVPARRVRGMAWITARTVRRIGGF